MKQGPVVVATLAALFATACAVRMGGPKPVDVDAAVIVAPSTTAPEQIAQQLGQRGIEYAIISAPRDSAFFAELATRANLKTTRPGKAGTTTFAFIGPQALGDTTLSINVPGGGQVRIHDALYRIDKVRRLDLLVARIDQNANLQSAIGELLKYVAKDVGPTAALLLAIEPPIAALGDSVSVLTRAAFSDVWECTPEGRRGARASHLPIRVFAGPAVRMRCESAEIIDVGTTAILGHFELPR